MAANGSENQSVVQRTTADVLASLVVFMVALPLCVAVAKACGLSAEAGIITGVIGGIVVGLLSGSPLQVSGPPAGLIVIVVGLVVVPGSPDDPAVKAEQASAFARYGLALFLAGVFQIVAAWLQLGQWFRAVAPAVVMGMLAGIGVIIIAKQFHVLFDSHAPAEIDDAIMMVHQPLQDVFTTPTVPKPEDTDDGTYPVRVFGTFTITQAAAAAVIGVLTIVGMVAWKAFAPKRVKLVPGAVIAVVVTGLIAYLDSWPIDKVDIGHLSNGIRWIQWPGLAGLFDSRVWIGAGTLAVVASCETLLCATAVDTRTPLVQTNYNKELFAQGVGNMLCGVLGVLPITGVIVRSSANLDAGAKTRLSAVLHGIWLLVFALFLPGVIAHVPTAALAGVLVYTGWKLLDLPTAWKWVKDPYGRSEALVYAVTCVAIVMTDLLVGVLIGMAFYSARLLWKASKLRIQTLVGDDGVVHVYLDGGATYLRLPHISDALEAIPLGGKIVVHSEKLHLIDHAIMDLLIGFKDKYDQSGGTVELDIDRLHRLFRMEYHPVEGKRFGVDVMDEVEDEKAAKPVSV